MFSGSEWFWILGMLAVVGLIAWMIAPRRDAPVTSHSAVVQGTPAEVTHDLIGVLSRRRGVSVHAWPDGIVLLERRTLPGWSILLAIIAFPVGVVALLARDVHSGTIVATDTGDGTTKMSIRGRFDVRDIARINEVIAARSGS